MCVPVARNEVEFMSCTNVCTSQHTISDAELRQKTEQHPCYSKDAHHKYARMHLPVAPACNISCNYCNRKFDCVHESRPGVTSEILTPQAAKDKFLLVKEKIAQLTVVGIAGPGDALANWPAVKESLQLIRRDSPDTIFCLSTNGLMLPTYAAELVALGVQHVTVTVNCLDPAIGAQLYKQVVFGGKTYTGQEGAAILLRNQLAGIEYLTQQGVLVKVNIVMVKGINDQHIPAVVKKVKELGVFMTNIMPLIPAPGSVFQDFPQTSMKEINDMRDQCQLDIQQMRHCQQCRADAIGLLREDRSAEFRAAGGAQERDFASIERSQEPATSSKAYRIAVTSKYGRLVDMHFGHADEFMIFEGDSTGFNLVERRKSVKYCLGMTDCDEELSRREAVLEALADCDAVLTMRIGHNAQQMLLDKGITSVEHCYTVETGLTYAIECLTLKKAM